MSAAYAPLCDTPGLSFYSLQLQVPDHLSLTDTRDEAKAAV